MVETAKKLTQMETPVKILELVKPQLATPFDESVLPQPSYNCEICKDLERVYFDEEKFGRVYKIGKDCVCKLEKIRRKRLSIIPEKFLGAMLESLQPDTEKHPNQAKIVSAIKANPRAKPVYTAPIRRPYPYNPVTLGDFLRKKRLDLNLTQKQVADLLKIDVCNIRNWELNYGQISLRFRPRIIEFIGFCPYDASLPLNLRLKERRENFGLSIKALARILGVDPCTIAYWERGDHQPSPKSIEIIKGFLKLSMSESFRC